VKALRYLLPLAALLILLVAPFVGEIPLHLARLGEAQSIDHRIFFELRLPRVLLAFLVGGILSLGGLLFQSLFRNPMSTPFTLGVASGATLLSAVAILTGLGLYAPLFSFVGAMSTVLLLYLIGRGVEGYGTDTLLLAGIALSFFYAAALMVAYAFSDIEQNFEIMRFTMGSLEISGYGKVAMLFAVALAFVLYSYRKREGLRMLLVSHDFAHLQGMDVRAFTLGMLTLTSVAVGAAVSIAGPVGFVGLIVPHILRILFAQSAQRLILPSFFYGGIFLVACDLVTRTLPVQIQLPIGVVTAFVGAPFFIYLIMRRRHL